jgi:GTP-binding protein EngB required for normal cell division
MSSLSLRKKQTEVPEHTGASGLVAQSDALVEALDAGGHRLDAQHAAAARRVVARLGERLRLSGDHTVVALAGATGSGKSSLFNALTGLDIATVGARRPTTATATACVWGVEGADALLEWLGVPRRHRVSHESVLTSGQDDLHGLVLLDLPDHDSTEASHRAEVDRLVELVDVLVWVTDPQKYADAAMHRRYLSRFAGHDAVTVVVLNQGDRLEGDALEACRRDLARLVLADGLTAAPVLVTSATTGAGLGELREVVVEAVGRRTAFTERLVADLRAAAGRLRYGVGDLETDPAELEQGTGLVDALSAAAGVPAVVAAVEGDYERGALAAAGWPFTRWVRRLRPDPLRRLRVGASSGSPSPADGDLARQVATVRSSLPAPTATQRSSVELATRRVADRAAARPPQDDLSDALDQAVVATELDRRRPTWWRAVGAVQVVLALAAVVGLVWLVALAVTGWLRLPEPSTPRLGPLPWPTLLLLGGALLGLALGALVRTLSRVGARRRGAAVRARLHAAVERVARERVLAPVTVVLADHRATREALERVGG